MVENKPLISNIDGIRTVYGLFNNTVKRQRMLFLIPNI